jgi:HAD superfamily hydrolase (TIGR01484 family)
VSADSARLVLATDLDGTMAHGARATRDHLFGLLRAHPDATLLYVTGRTPAATRTLAADIALPAPDVLIADVGTSVLRGFGPDRVEEVEAELDRLWPGGDEVRARLADLAAELAPQAIAAPRRVSYWIESVRRLRVDDAAVDDAFAARPPDDPSLGGDAAEVARQVAARAADRLAGLAVDVLVSANVFLDVLPRGVHKGSTLLRVLRWLDVPGEACVVAGDSLNDLGLFETGLRGIAVGNCEPALRQRVAGMAHVYQATGEGVAGLLEGLRHHGHFPHGADGGQLDGE